MKGRVVVVGTGLAGLTACIEAASSGASVVLIEKEKNVGGNSAKASSGMNACPSPPQSQQGIQDSLASFLADTDKSGKGLAEPALESNLVNLSLSAWQWLSRFDLDLSTISQCGGHSHPRTHRLAPRPDGKPNPVGWGIVSKLKEFAATLDNVEIKTVHRATQLLTKNSRDGDVVVGVQCEAGGDTMNVLGDAVVLCTGGYGYSGTSDKPNLLLLEHCPDKKDLPTTCGPFATGDGVVLARNVGAALTDMDQVQVHPTGLVDPKDPLNKSKFLGPEALRGSGGILVNSSGNRFINELSTRDVVSAGIFDNCQVSPAGSTQKVAYLLMSEDSAKKFGEAMLGFYQHKGFIRKFDNEVALGTEFGIPTDALTATISDYAESSQGSKEDTFGKTVFPSNDFGAGKVIYVATVTPCIHFTMGGVSINAAAEVQKLTRNWDNRKAILGLYAAGEVTGGVHGANRLAGNALLESVVFGRIAGARAAAMTLYKSPPLSSEEFVPLTFRESISLGEQTKIFRFNLPSGRHRTGMGIGQYVAVRANIDGEDVTRYYSPISRPRDHGLIDLLVKVDDKGNMSKFLSNLAPGKTLQFKGPLGDLDLPRPSKQKIGMLCGGVGISPMLQIIRSYFWEELSAELNLLYGAVNESELVYSDKLLKWKERHPNFSCTLTVDKPISDDWDGEVGFIDADKVRKHMFPPGEDVLIVICGPYKMCQVMKEMLKSLGYTEDMVYSFM